MCLSTVYRNTVAPEEVIMKNVMTIEQKDGVIILTDLAGGLCGPLPGQGYAAGRGWLRCDQGSKNGLTFSLRHFAAGNFLMRN